MHRIARIAVLLAIVECGWLAFDGTHALLIGDYVTPASGRFAGQLGPWSRVVALIGLEPRSTLTKSLHLILGVTGFWLSPDSSSTGVGPGGG